MLQLSQKMFSAMPTGIGTALAETGAWNLGPQTLQGSKYYAKAVTCQSVEKTLLKTWCWTINVIPYCVEHRLG